MERLASLTDVERDRMRVPCPTCGGCSGELCRRKGDSEGWSRTLHAERKSPTRKRRTTMVAAPPDPVVDRLDAIAAGLDRLAGALSPEGGK